jgi:hypothetical protein
MGEKAEKAWHECHAFWEEARRIEQEALDLVKVEEQRDYALIEKKFRQAEEFFKKRNDAFKRHLQHLKRGD